MKQTAHSRAATVAACLLLGASPSHAEPAPTPAASPSAEPVQGPTEGNPPGAPAARGASPGGATNAGEDATEQPFANRLLGDFGGVRTKLAGYGVSLGLTEQSEVLGSLGRVEANALKVHEDGPSGLDVDNQTLAQDAAGPSTPTMMNGSTHNRGCFPAHVR